MSNPFEDPVAPRPYQQHTGAQYPPVSRPQGILHCFIFYVFLFVSRLFISFFIVSHCFHFYDDMIRESPLSLSDLLFMLYDKIYEFVNIYKWLLLCSVLSHYCEDCVSPRSHGKGGIKKIPISNCAFTPNCTNNFSKAHNNN